MGGRQTRDRWEEHGQEPQKEVAARHDDDGTSLGVLCVRRHVSQSIECMTEWRKEGRSLIFLRSTRKQQEKQVPEVEYDA